MNELRLDRSVSSIVISGPRLSVQDSGVTGSILPRHLYSVVENCSKAVQAKSTRFGDRLEFDWSNSQSRFKFYVT